MGIYFHFLKFYMKKYKDCINDSLIHKKLSHQLINLRYPVDTLLILKAYVY